MSDEELQLLRWDTAELRITVNPVEFTGEVVWTSSDENVVSISEAGDSQEGGCLAVLSANDYGVATITATVNGISASCVVTVFQEVEDIEVIPDHMILYRGQSRQMTVNVWPENAANKQLKFKSGDESVVFDDDGNASYYINSILQEDYYGLVEHKGEWYYVAAGYAQLEHYGVVLHEGTWFFVDEGIVDFTYTGVAPNANGWWRIENGQVKVFFDGLGQNEHGWWYIKDGKVDFSFSGVHKDSNGTWYFQNGKRVYNLPTMLILSLKKHIVPEIHQS